MSIVTHYEDTFAWIHELIFILNLMSTQQADKCSLWCRHDVNKNENYIKKIGWKTNKNYTDGYVFYGIQWLYNDLVSFNIP